MKYSRKATECKTHAIPGLRFENQRLTSFAGLVLLIPFFQALRLKESLGACFRHVRRGKVYSRAALFLQLILHLLLGFRELRDSDAYREDPMILRLLGVRRLPDVATLSRMLKEADPRTNARLRRLMARLILERLQALALRRITLDFDGSVQSTSRRAEGTAVGFNKKKKGARSYYPLFCTVAQTGQALDVLHRSGNVHDSHGAREFMLACIHTVRAAMPGAIIEVRADSAFFSDELVSTLQGENVEFTISVPFERFVQLKDMIERRRDWTPIDQDRWYFTSTWRPKCWDRRYRFLFIRKRMHVQRKGPVQLDLFEPREEGFDFKVIVTNRAVEAGAAATFHEGRGSQEGIFAQLKTQCAMGHVPVRRREGNQMYLLAGLFAHNLMREWQMRTREPIRGTTPGRAALWAFEKIETLRMTLLHRAGRFTNPSGTLTLTIAGNAPVRNLFLATLARLAAAA